MINSAIVDIGAELKRYFVESLYRTAEVSLFVCGGASKSDAALRTALGARIIATKSKYSYSVHYPESLFIEAILGHRRRDLLELENLLAESVSAVVIPLHSPGTFTELGAFANHPNLSQKLVVVVSPEYRLDNSFINTGPLRYLRRHTSSAIIYHDLSISAVDSLARAVAEAARKVASHAPVAPSLRNPIAAKDFFFALAVVLEPLPRSIALEIAATLSPGSDDRIAIVTETVLNLLVNERRLISLHGNLTATSQSVDKFFGDITTDRKRSETQDLIWRLRTRAINSTYRRKSFAWR